MSFTNFKTTTGDLASLGAFAPIFMALIREPELLPRLAMLASPDAKPPTREDAMALLEKAGEAINWLAALHRPVVVADQPKQPA